jgi:Family of unknown function (DUF6011)
MNTHDDPLDDLFGGAPAAPRVAPQTERAQAIRNAVTETFAENCRKCGGSGRFGRFGQCFACKGRGRLEFKTSPQTRERNRLVAADRKARAEEQNLAAFAKAHKAEHAWMVTQAPSFEFARAMLEAVIKFGDLTEKQMAAVQKCVARAQTRVTERAAREAAAPAVDVSKIEAAFARARQGAADDREGIKWLSLRLDTFKFSDAPARDPWPAAIFVKEGEAKLGRIVGGKFICSRVCDDATQARVLAAIADPAAAAIAFGQRTGSCSVCGRELTNAESRKLGIGPICAEKFGF